MPGIDIDKLDDAVPTIRAARAVLNGHFDSSNVPLRDFKKLYDQFLDMTENCLFELKDQRETIGKRNREIADLKRRLREFGGFVP